MVSKVLQFIHEQSPFSAMLWRLVTLLSLACQFNLVFRAKVEDSPLISALIAPDWQLSPEVGSFNAVDCVS
jgi:hypothetical protein